MMSRGSIRLLVLLVLSGAFSGVSLASTADDEIRVVGKLISVEPAPGCGGLLIGSPATYQVISGQGDLVGSQVQVLIACIEMPLIEGDVKAFNVGDIHDLIITRRNINKIELPDLPSGSWFYLQAASFPVLQPNNSFKPNPHQGGA